MDQTASRRAVFVTGASGFMGRSPIPELVRRGHKVRALVRPGSERKLPPGCQELLGDALFKETYVAKVPPADAFVQLVGVTHPNPAKGDQFSAIDLASVEAAVAAAIESGVRHFVYVSATQPASIMKAYIEVGAGRSTNSLRRPQRHDPAALVRPGSGTPLAAFGLTDLPDTGASPGDQGVGTALGTRDPRADSERASQRGGPSRPRYPYLGRAADSARGLGTRRPEGVRGKPPPIDHCNLGKSLTEA